MAISLFQQTNLSSNGSHFFTTGVRQFPENATAPSFEASLVEFSSNSIPSLFERAMNWLFPPIPKDSILFACTLQAGIMFEDCQTISNHLKEQFPDKDVDLAVFKPEKISHVFPDATFKFIDELRTHDYTLLVTYPSIQPDENGDSKGAIAFLDARKEMILNLQWYDTSQELIDTVNAAYSEETHSSRCYGLGLGNKDLGLIHTPFTSTKPMDLLEAPLQEILKGHKHLHVAFTRDKPFFLAYIETVALMNEPDTTIVLIGERIGGNIDIRDLKRTLQETGVTLVNYYGTLGAGDFETFLPYQLTSVKISSKGSSNVLRIVRIRLISMNQIRALAQMADTVATSVTSFFVNALFAEKPIFYHNGHSLQRLPVQLGQIAVTVNPTFAVLNYLLFTTCTNEWLERYSQGNRSDISTLSHHLKRTREMQAERKELASRLRPYNALNKITALVNEMLNRSWFFTKWFR